MQIRESCDVFFYIIFNRNFIKSYYKIYIFLIQSFSIFVCLLLTYSYQKFYFKKLMLQTSNNIIFTNK